MSPVESRKPPKPGGLPLAPVLLLLLLAAGLRIWSVGALYRDPRVNDPILDGLHYITLATGLSRGQGWPAGPLFMTPFYPLVLSLLFRLSAPSVLSVFVFQSVLGLGTLILLVLTARRDFGAGAAVAAGLLYVLCGPVLAMESQVLTESLLLFLAAAALWLWPYRGRTKSAYLGFGIICGLMTIGRGVFLLLPFAAMTMEWIGSKGSSRGVPPGAHPAGVPRDHGIPVGTGPGIGLRVALTGAGVLLALLPLAIHQTRAAGHLQLLTSNGGLNLYIGNNPGARGIYSQPPEIDLEEDFTGARSASLLAGRNLTLEESSGFWARQALEFARRDPGRALWLLGRKALLFFSPREIPQIEDFQLLRRSAVPLRAAFVDFRWLLPLAVLGVFSRRRNALIPWLALVAIGWISTVLFFATGRYRIPFLVGFLGLAAAGTEVLVRMARARRFGRALLVLPVVVVAQLVLPGYPMAKAEAHDLYQLGVRMDRKGETAAALEEYRRAAQVWPEGGDAWHGIGVCLVKLGRMQDAVEAYSRAIARMPGSALTHYNLGCVYGRLGDDAKALEELREAARLNPLDPRIGADLGVALARNGRTPEAVTVLREVLRKNPGFEPARRSLEALGAPM